jgi:DNA-binding CsgD family transcriptional regulator
MAASAAEKALSRRRISLFSYIRCERSHRALMGPGGIATGRTVAGVTPRDRDRIVGRARELSQLDGLLTALTAGAGGLAWVRGEPGTGKSALTDVVLAEARDRGLPVLRAAGDKLMQAFPLRLMAECLGISARPADPAGGEIAALLRGELADDGPLDAVATAAGRMLDLVERMCADGPFVIALEDLHWADEPTRQLWARLARRAGELPLLLLGTSRPLPGPPGLDLAGRAATVIDLAPLDPESIAELAAQLAGAGPGPRLRDALGRAGGNPWYASELLSALRRDGLIEVTGGIAELTGDPAVTPASLRAAVAGQLGFLLPAVHQTLQLAALLGPDFAAGELTAITGRSAAEIAEALGHAVTAGIIGEAGGRLRFRHELVRQVFAEQTPAAIRPALHGEIAARLAATGAAPAAVARQLEHVPGPRDDWTLTWLASVPESALYLLPQLAADLLGRALEAAADDTGRWELLAVRLALVSFWLGRDDQAAAIADEVAARTCDQVVRARMRILILRAAARVGRPGDARSRLLRSPQDDRLPARWRARLGAWSAQLLTGLGDQAGGAALAAEALRQAVACGDELAEAEARYAGAMCLGATSRPASLAAALRILPDPSPGADAESADLRLLVTAAHLAESAEHGRLAEIEATLARVLPLADQLDTLSAARVRVAAAEFCYRYGRWDEAAAHLARVRPEFLDTRMLRPGHALAALIALRREDKGAADAHLRAGAAGWPAQAGQAPAAGGALHRARAMRAESDGDLAGAVQAMSPCLLVPPEPRAQRWRDGLPYLVRLSLAAGDAAMARAAAEASQADAAATGSPGRVAAAAFCRALVADDSAGLLSVAEDYRGHGWLPMAAAALEEAAVSLAAGGDVARARSTLASAVHTYERFGATWDVRRASARLRRHGIRRGPQHGSPRPARGWAALTPSEVTIARMVAQGLSNPDIARELFVSRRTVQTHVSNILGKLELHSRIDICRVTEPQPLALSGDAPPRD